MSVWDDLLVVGIAVWCAVWFGAAFWVASGREPWPSFRKRG